MWLEHYILANLQTTIILMYKCNLELFNMHSGVNYAPKQPQTKQLQKQWFCFFMCCCWRNKLLEFNVHRSRGAVRRRMHLAGCAIVWHSWKSLITIGIPGVDGRGERKKKRFSEAGAGTAHAGASRLTKGVKIATSPCTSITPLPSHISSPLSPQHQSHPCPSPPPPCF